MPISTLPRVRDILRVLLACFAFGAIVAPAVGHADDPKFALGLNLGGLWGQSEVEGGAVDLVTPARFDSGPPIQAGTIKTYFKPHTPRHWFLSVQLGFDGKLARGGVRVGFNHQQVRVEDVGWDHDRTLVRVGPYLGPVLWRGALRGVPLTAYAEAAFYADNYLLSAPIDQKWLNLAPSLGVGMDARLWRGLNVGFYGGFSYSFYAEGLKDADWSRERTKGFFEGDVRLTLLYVFGAERAAHGT